MLGGSKPWVKALYDNFLMVITILVILLIRIYEKTLNLQFGIYNFLAFLISSIGFCCLCYSKREQLKRKEFFKFGVGTGSFCDQKFYRWGMFF